MAKAKAKRQVYCERCQAAYTTEGEWPEWCDECNPSHRPKGHSSRKAVEARARVLRVTLSKGAVQYATLIESSTDPRDPAHFGEIKQEALDRLEADEAWPDENPADWELVSIIVETEGV